jgi:hypothetical protein
MKQLLSIFFISVISTSVWAAKDCNELLNEIKSKLDAKGVKNYDLQIVDKSQTTDLKIVGTCGGDQKKITYIRK